MYSCVDILRIRWWKRPENGRFGSVTSRHVRGLLLSKCERLRLRTASMRSISQKPRHCGAAADTFSKGQLPMRSRCPSLSRAWQPHTYLYSSSVPADTTNTLSSKSPDQSIRAEFNNQPGEQECQHKDIVLGLACIVVHCRSYLHGLRSTENALCTKQQMVVSYSSCRENA